MLQDAAAAALEGALKSFVRACEATADSGMPDLDSLDKEIATKQPLMQQVISQPDTVQTSTVDTAMQVVQLLHRKYEGEQCLSCGLVRLSTCFVPDSFPELRAMHDHVTQWHTVLCRASGQ